MSRRASSAKASRLSIEEVKVDIDEIIQESIEDSTTNPLLKKENNAQVTPSTRSPRVCFVSVRILSLSDINMSENTFKADIILFLIWDAEELLPKIKAGEDIDWDEQWSPKVTIANCKEVEADFFTNDTTQPKAIKLPDWDSHKVLHARKIQVLLSQRYELRQFPFDMQLLHIIFRSQDHQKLIVLKRMFEPKFMNSISSMAGNMVAEWRVHYPTDAEALDDYSLNQTYSIYIVAVPVDRLPGYYLHNIIIVMFVLGSLGLGVFVIPATTAKVSDRIQFLLTMLLTILAFKFVANDNLPQIQYMTWLDKYLAATMAFQAFMLLCCYYVGWRLNVGQTDHSVMLADRACVYISLALWFIAHAVLTMQVVGARRNRRALLKHNDEKWVGKRNMEHGDSAGFSLRDSYGNTLSKLKRKLPELDDFVSKATGAAGDDVGVGGGGIQAVAAGEKKKGEQKEKEETSPKMRFRTNTLDRLRRTVGKGNRRNKEPVSADRFMNASSGGAALAELNQRQESFAL